MLDLPDEILIKQVQKGDDKAFEHLLGRYKILIDKIIRRYYLPSYESEDFYQIASLAFHRAILTYEKQGNATFYTYALSCIRNKLVSLYRQELMKREYAVDIEEMTVIAEARENYVLEKSDVLEEEQDTLLHHYRAELDKLLGKKSFFGDIEQKCLRAVIEGFTYSEIAEKYGFDHTKISNAMTRVRAKLKKHGFAD